MFIADRLTIGETKRTKEGYLAVRARAARAGIYDYQGREIDPEGKHFAADQVVRVYRPEEEVFNRDSVHSFMLKPITDDHPASPVTADNWRNHAKGVNAGAMRDGEFLAFDLVLMDAALIKAVEDGKRELSNGYSSEILIEPGITDEGKSYDAIQRHIRGNHIAVVDRGRAGPLCRISDAAACEAFPLPQAVLDQLFERTYSAAGNGDNKSPTNGVSQSGIPSGGGAPTQDGESKMPHVLMIDGLQVPNVSDEAKAAIEKLQGQVTALTADKAALDTKVGELTAANATKDGEIAGLNQKLKDAEISPAKLQQLAADRAKLIEQAKAIDPAVVTDGKSDAEIRAAVVQAKLGDAAPTEENGIAGAFTVLSAQSADGKPDPLRTAISAKPVQIADAAAVRDTARAMQYS